MTAQFEEVKCFSDSMFFGYNFCIFESEFMEMDREAIVSLLSPMLMKLKPVEQSDKGTAEKVTWKMLKKLIN